LTSCYYRCYACPYPYRCFLMTNKTSSPLHKTQNDWKTLEVFKTSIHDLEPVCKTINALEINPNQVNNVRHKCPEEA